MLNLFRPFLNVFSPLQLRPPTGALLYTFGGESGAEGKWRVVTDAAFGGQSEAEFMSREESLPSSAEQGEEGGKGPTITFAEFRGIYRTSLLPSASIKRGGIASLRSPLDTRNLDAFDTLVLRMKGDGRSYLLSLKTENFIDPSAGRDEVWQAPLRAETLGSGEWRDVSVPLDSFLLTFRGRLVEAAIEMNKRRVQSIAVSVVGNVDGEGVEEEEGEFSLCIKSIRAVESKDKEGEKSVGS